MIKLGCCGWSYFDAKARFGPDWKKRFASKLQAYAKLFDLVEINSTFYRIPKLATAQRWREEADGMNKKFEFSLKCSQIITHKDVFAESAFWAFDQMKAIAQELRARILLLQSPASFRPTRANIARARKFFSRIDREDFVLVWELRWAKSWTKAIVGPLLRELRLEQCVDPFRQDWAISRALSYYRLHGLGRPSMYNYRFSDAELKGLKRRVVADARKRDVYVLFNNIWMYDDALRFSALI